MSKRVKCAECSCSMHWALPNGVTEHNYEYAKHCLVVAKRSIVCGVTMKTKKLDHEQYCKKFIKKTDWDIRYDCIFQKEILKLEQMIKDYERDFFVDCIKESEFHEN